QVSSPLPDHDSAIVLKVRTTVKDAALLPPDWKAYFPPLPGLSEEERWSMTWVTIPPSFFMSCHADNMHYFVVLPREAESLTVLSGWCFPESTIALPDFQEKLATLRQTLIPLFEQDVWACESVQKGLRSSLASRGRFAWEE